MTAQKQPEQVQLQEETSSTRRQSLTLQSCIWTKERLLEQTRLKRTCLSSDQLAARRCSDDGSGSSRSPRGPWTLQRQLGFILYRRYFAVWRIQELKQVKKPVHTRSSLLKTLCLTSTSTRGAAHMWQEVRKSRSLLQVLDFQSFLWIKVQETDEKVNKEAKAL